MKNQYLNLYNRILIMQYAQQSMQIVEKNLLAQTLQE